MNYQDKLNISVSEIQGWIGGEHGIVAIPLWSTTRIKNSPLEKFVDYNKKKLDKYQILSYVKSVSKLIINNKGGTEYGPNTSFRDITKAIVEDSKEILSIAAPIRFKETPESVHVRIPTSLGNKLGSSLYSKLSISEKQGIIRATKKYTKTIEKLL